MHHFDFNLLDALEALLSEKCVTRAAARLQVTQSTMSGKLKRLRYHFHDEILVRSGRHMELTHLGESLTKPLQNVLRDIDSLVLYETKFSPESVDRIFTVAASSFCNSLILPKVITRIASVAPGIRIACAPLHRTRERMASGEVDLCIQINETALVNDGENILQESLYNDRLVCVVCNTHPLDANATAAEFVKHPLIGVETDAGSEIFGAEPLKNVDPRFRPVITASDFSVVPAMVAQSSLIALVPMRLARSAARSLPIRYFEPPFAMSGVNITMLWHARFVEDPAHRWLRMALLEVRDALLGEKMDMRTTLSKPTEVPILTDSMH